MFTVSQSSKHEMTNGYQVSLLFKVKCKALVQNTPCKDQEHLYIFRLLCLDTRLGLSLFFWTSCQTTFQCSKIL